MKSLRIPCIVLLYFLSNVAFANQANYFTIYGAEKINNYHRSMRIPVQVQMGSFSTENAAKRYAASLSAKTSYHVHIQAVSKHYKVLVGPFYTYTSLNDFAQHPSKPKTHVEPKITQKHEHAHKWFVGGQIGGQSIEANASTIVNNGSGLTTPYDRDIYTMSRSDTSTLLGLQAGRRFEFEHPWLSALSLGVQYQYFFAANAQGQVTQFSLPQFTNYNTTWETETNLLIANAKLNLITYRQVSPYLNGGIGGVFKNSKGYTETALSNVTPRISPNYQTNTHSQFSYILGAGIDYLLQQRILLTAGYQYTYLGNLSSGFGRDRWSTQYLNFGRADSNAFLFGLTYLFDAKEQP